MPVYKVTVEANVLITAQIEIEADSEELAEEQAESQFRDSLEAHTGESDFEEDADVDFITVDASASRTREIVMSEKVSCKICGNPTQLVHIQLCQLCWEFDAKFDELLKRNRSGAEKWLQDKASQCGGRLKF